jgi:hypothetical protein
VIPEHELNPHLREAIQRSRGPVSRSSHAV